MPFYEYQCARCGHDVEVLQKISDPPLRKCPNCGKNALVKLVSAPVFRLKGSGWYETDFKSDQEGKRNLAGESEAGAEAKADASDSKADSKDDSKADTKVDTKVDTKADTKAESSSAAESKSEPAGKAAAKSSAKPAAKKTKPARPAPRKRAGAVAKGRRRA